MSNNETPFLHGLADDLGVPARQARHALLLALAPSFSMNTADKLTEFYVSAIDVAAVDPDTTVAHPTTITASVEASSADKLDDGISIAPKQTATVLCSDEGMFPESNEEGVNGFDYAVTAAGSDDDPMVILTIKGIAENGVEVKHTLRGSGTVPLPLRAVNSAFIMELHNPQEGGGSYCTVAFQATSRYAKSSVSTAGRDSLRAAGIPVGKAKLSILAKSAEIAQTVASGQVRAAKGDRHAVRKAGQALSRVLGSPALPLAKRLFAGIPKQSNPRVSKRGGGLFPGLRLMRRRR